MANQAFVAYRVQLPDGSEAIRSSGWAQPPTHGQLADYSANRGEVYLGPAAMSPAPEATPAAPAAPPPAPPPPPAPAPAAAAAPQPGIGTTLAQTFLPERTFTSEVPSIIGGTAAGMAVAPYAPWLTPFAAGAGSSAGEAARVGYETLTGQPPAEAGTLRERMGRAYARGAAGEVVTAPVRAGVKYAARVVKPLLKAAEGLEPVLAAAEPAEGTLAHWWQTASKGGAKNVVQAWDELGEAGQRGMAGAQHGEMSTVVESLRTSGGLPVAQMTPGEIARASIPGTVLATMGHPYLAAGATIAAEEMSKRAPRLLLYPPTRSLLAGLPAVGRAVAPPANFLLRTAGQAGAATPADWTRYQ